MPKKCLKLMPGDILRLKEQVRFTRIYGDNGFVIDDSSILHSSDNNIMLFLGFEYMKSTTFCKVLIPSRQLVGYVIYDMLERM